MARASEYIDHAATHQPARTLKSGDRMPVCYDPLLVAGLAAEIEHRWLGAELRELNLDRTRRIARLEFRRLPPLLFLLHPTAGHIVTASGPTASGRGARRIELRRQRLYEIRTEEDERLLRFAFGTRRSTPAFFLFVELHTNQWNAVLVSAGTGTVADLLWPRTAGSRPLRPGSPYHPPGRAEGKRSVPTAETWLAHLSPLPEADRRGAALRKFASLSRINVDAVFAPLPAGSGSGSLLEAHARYLALRTAREGSWLLQRRWGEQPYVSDLGEGDATSVPTLLEAMALAARGAGVLEPATRSSVPTPDGDLPASDGAESPEIPIPSRLTPEQTALRQALEVRLDRERRRADALRRQLEEGPDAAKLRESGHLLLAHASQITRGSTRVRLADFAGGVREIELDPALGAAQNADRLYRAARKRERAVAGIPALLEEAARRTQRLETILADFPPSGMCEDELWSLAGGRPGTTPGREAARLPYRRYRSSGGLEIRVGRGARSNDELTARHSAPDDIWLHARQVPGAHVVLRWGRKSENPPRRDLLEAATAAAVFSEARHSGTVAVDWTRRKYVRKPRKASPGQVVIERAGTLFVEPDAEWLARLRDSG